MSKKRLREAIRKEVRNVLSEEEQNQDKYDRFMQKMMDIFGIDSPDELSDKHKDDFFSFVDMGWDENEDSIDDEAIELAKKYVKDNNLKNESSMNIPESFKKMVRERVNSGMDKKEAVRNTIKTLRKHANSN